MCYDSKYEMMILVEAPLVKEQSSIKDGQVHTPLDISDYL